MSYFADLTEYSYLEKEPGVLNVGWLEPPHAFPTAEPDAALVRRLGHAAVHARCKQTRGYHPCRFCGAAGYPVRIRVAGETLQLGSAELRVPDGEVVYAAPNLIVHYVSEHKYSPPDAFIRAIIAAVPERA